MAAEYEWAWQEPVAEDEPGPIAEKYVAKPGKALVKYPNGDEYSGSFNEAKQKHGKGTYTWSSAPGANPWGPALDSETPLEFTVRYEGTYVDGKRNGVGKMSFPNGERYHGGWENDKFHGEGTYYYKNGDIYSGEWKAGVRNGKGTFLFAADESQIVGQFEKGNMVTGKWVWRDGTSWQGPFKDSRPVGRGVFYFPNGTMQEGEYLSVPDEAAGGEAMKLLWKGGAVRAANTSAADVTRATD